MAMVNAQAMALEQFDHFKVWCNNLPPLWIGIYAGVAAGRGSLEVEYEYFQVNTGDTP